MTFGQAVAGFSLAFGVFLSAANIKQTQDINRQARDINSTLTKQIAAVKEDTPVAAPKPQCDAAEDGKCECFDKGGCKCAAGKQCSNPDPKAKLRPLYRLEYLDLMKTHGGSFLDWLESGDVADELAFKEVMVGQWLLENPSHDPRLPQPIPAPPAVKAAPIAAPKYTQPQPVATLRESRIVQPAATHVLRWQPTYGPFGRERGGQWVRVPVNQARQYRAPQPTYRTYRSCANGSCR